MDKININVVDFTQAGGPSGPSIGQVYIDLDGTLRRGVFAGQSKASFEAVRQAMKEKYDASGFVHMGKHASQPPSIMNINEGLWSFPADGFQNKLTLGRGEAYAKSGSSKFDYSVLNVAGVIFSFDSLPYSEYVVKFPQAPNGKTTYHKNTGEIRTHVDPAAAFLYAGQSDNIEVVTDRVDMWGFESWLEEVSLASPYVYPNGLIQSTSTTMDGIPTSDSGRPVSYYAVFDGDTGSRGKGLDVTNLSFVQLATILANHKNNLYYLEDGRLVQWRLRQRTVAGAGNGDWEDYEANTQLYSRAFAFGDGKNYVFAQSSSNLVLDAPHYYDSTGHANNINPERGLYSARGIDEECYFLVCGTVNRLNQGAYHPSFNPSGSATLSQLGQNVWQWHQLPNHITSTLSCFMPATDSSVGQRGGSIAEGNILAGRPDGRYYDAIYSSGQGGVCRDMRYSALGLDLIDFAEADQRVKNGTYQGFEFGRITKVISFVTSSSETASDYGRVPMTRAEALRVCGLIGVSTAGATIFHQAKMAVSLYNPNNGKVIHSSAILAAQGNSNFGTYLDPANQSAIWLEFDQKVVENSLSGNQVLRVAGDTGSANSNIFCSSGQTLYAIVTTLDKVSVGGSFLQTDVIGNPDNILVTPALANGWQGSWGGLPINGTPAQAPLTRKCLSTVVHTVYKIVGGWGSSATESVNHVNNTVNHAVVDASSVLIEQYQAFAKQTENTVKRPVYGGNSGVSKMVDVHSWFDIGYGTSLVESCLGRVLTNSNGDASVAVNEGLIVTSSILDPDGGLHWYRPSQLPKHAALSLGSPLGSTLAMKSLNYNVNINQQAFIQYTYTELKHNGTNWGDDGKIHIADNQSTKPDANGNTVLFGTARLREPIGWLAKSSQPRNAGRSVVRLGFRKWATTISATIEAEFNRYGKTTASNLM